MPRLYGPAGNVAISPGREDELSVRLNDFAAPADPCPPADVCVCDISGVFWEDQALAGVFDQTEVEYTIGDGVALYVAKITGDICPESTITLSSSWSGAGSGPDVKIIDHVATALIQDSFSDEGTLTISGNVDCDGDITSVGPIDLVITTSGDPDSNECPPGFVPLPDGTCVFVGG